MYELRYVLRHQYRESDEWFEYLYRLSKSCILLSDENFEKLVELSNKNEYNYTAPSDVLVLDKHPSIIKKKIDDTFFISDYFLRLKHNFFACYWYKKV